MDIDINELIAELIAARDNGYTTCELCAGVDYMNHTKYFANLSVMGEGQYNKMCIIFSMNHNYTNESGTFYKPFTDTESRFW